MVSAMERPAFTIGVEEEYLVVDRETRDLVERPPPEMWSTINEVIGSAATHELLKAQIEIRTDVCTDLTQVRRQIADMRSELDKVTSEYGAAIIAASTHPFAHWARQETTEDSRYLRLAKDFQRVAQQLMICGMHVHVGIEDPDLRIDLMNQVKYLLPHMLALSSSSPFWDGAPTGLMAYRLVIFKNLPRTGIPEEFESWGEYQRYVKILVNAGLIEDSSKLWWDIRPSSRYPTLEMRISEMCTRIDDAMTVAAIYLCSLSMLYRLRRKNQKWRVYSPSLIEENVWRAQRYGTDGSLMDFGKGELVSMPDLIEEFIEVLAQDAMQFNVGDEIRNARNIVRDGTSSHRQLAVYETALADGASEREALQAVVDHLIVDSMAGLKT